MPGRPVLRDRAHRIEALGGEDYVLGQIAGGVSLSYVARRLGASYWLLRDWVRQGGQPRRSLYRLAKACARDGSGPEEYQAERRSQAFQQLALHGALGDPAT